MPTGCGSDELLAADVDQLGHATVVRPRGEIDMSSVDILQDALRRAVTEGNSDIVIDATELRFCDVRGMEVLDAASAKLANHHRRLVIANPSQSVRRVIRLLDVDRLLAEQDRDLAQP